MLQAADDTAEHMKVLQRCQRVELCCLKVSVLPAVGAKLLQTFDALEEVVDPLAEVVDLSGFVASREVVLDIFAHRLCPLEVACCQSVRCSVTRPSLTAPMNE